MLHRWMESPIDPFLTFAHDIDLGLPAQTHTDNDDSARRCLIANAVVAHLKDIPGVHYSRDNNHYAKRTSLFPHWYSRRTIVRSVDDLEVAGLLQTKTTRPSPSAGYRSTFFATTELIKKTRAGGLSQFHVVRPPIEIRDRRSDTIVLPHRLPTNQRKLLRKLEQDVDAQNLLLSASRIELKKGSYPHTPDGIFAIGSSLIAPIKCVTFRVFNDNLNFGGRWYGPWWQNIPKAARGKLLIEGEPTVEVDLSACQVRLAYGVVGLNDPLRGAVDRREIDTDLYALPSVARKVAKQAALIMLNARNEASAVKAVAKWLRENHAGPARTAHEEASRVVCGVAEHFAELREIWFTDLGVRLQNLDSEVCTEVQREFRERGIPVLSVHDSFIVGMQHECDLRRVIRAAFANAMEAARNT